MPPQRACRKEGMARCRLQGIAAVLALAAWALLPEPLAGEKH